MIAGLAFIRQNEFEGVSANINVSLHPNIRYYHLISNSQAQPASHLNG